MATQNEILKTLVECTHEFWKAEYLDEINPAFQTKIEGRRYTANPTNPKGLTLKNGAKFS
jgi:hypothetical protein